MAQRPDSIMEDEFNTAISFIRHVKTRLASDPAVYEDFLRVLRDLKTGKNPDRGAVAAEAYALLRGHPDIAVRLNEFVDDAFVPDERAPDRHAREDPAPTRPKRERRATPNAAAVVDPDTRGALQFFERVKKAGLYLYNSLLALIFDASSVEDVNQIYNRAVKIFGSAHRDLLAEFTEYLPAPKGRELERLMRRLAKKEPSPEQNPAPAPKRKAAAAAVAADNPSAPAKRPRINERKTTNRRANSPAVVDAAPESGGVSAFREAWELETKYTKLVATARRTNELLAQYEPPEDAPLPPRPSGRRSYEELFPNRECQEALQEMYHGMLPPIREALEDGARTVLALKRIKGRLEMLEQLAVDVASERRDPDRVEGRMRKLAVDRVLFLGEAKRRHVIARGDPYVHSVKH